ncbi:Uncharacterised protein [Serratia liquefaciens]|jgi:hypothetical protein|uniref:Uncharacterized protein n=1 Tax=Serratia liquefaciens TaxID=614 RepID=A0A379ZG97_SERLI|nr:MULTISPECIES: hypothetical protein [Serratia]AGQ30757.1 hypothetical protein M495_09970 [Serratia liquefaciens ATCC 27592]AMG98015.1 hypothetical protein AL485_01910 [Serratia liquefaciens]AYO37696.1 hypothetical protein EBA31_10505 [Serratia sp. P2ACOL2]MBF8104768.1 hypothetical protein [Serratia liquefaciens]MBH2810194.1 hypothetical protein [Serratia liquefaciens]
MLEQYYPATMSSKPITDEQHKRLVAVQAALELIKATLSDTNDGNGVDFQLKAAEKHVGPLADAIQEALK